MLHQFGVDPAGLRIAKRMREAHAAMRALLDTGSADLEGELLSYRGVFTTARPATRRVPLLIGAMGGPLTFRLAGEIADGVYAACSFSREALAYVVENVRVGAARAGREYGDLETCASVTAAVAEDGRAARRAARLKAAFYLPSMPPALIERHGIPFAEVEPINAAFARGDVEQALSLTSDEVGDRLSIAGTPEEVAERVHTDVFAAGFNHAVLALADREIPRIWAGTEIPGLPTLSEQVRLISERVLPLVAA
jgi:5,10-methylenetetrahydromethanopterin reductase